MLRSADKRLFTSGQLKDVFGGRLGGFPDALPGHLDNHALPVTADLRAWYDASALSSLTIAGACVSSVVDLSGNGFTATAAGVDRPMIARHPTLFNRRPVFVFTGVSQANTLASSAPMDDRTSTAFVVFMLNTLTSVSRTLIGGNNTTSNQFRVDVTTGRLATNSAGSVNIGTQGNAAVTVDTPSLGVQVLTATDVTHILNGTSETDANATAFTAGRTLWIGSQALAAGAREPFLGYIAEIVMYSATLSGADVTLVSDYLNAKWGIS